MKIYRELLKVSKIVKNILREEKQARNDDSYLYLEVLKVYECVLGLNVTYTSVQDFLTNPLYIGFPSFHTVSRARRKVQADNPELQSDRNIEKARRELEYEYKAYALLEEEENYGIKY